LANLGKEGTKAAEGIIADIAREEFETTGKKVGEDAARAAGKDAGEDAAKTADRAGLNFTPKDREKIFEENLDRNGGKHQCDYCGQDVYRRKSVKGVQGRPNDAQIDHEIPRSRGGHGSQENAHVTCRRCNRFKSTKTLEEMDDELREYL